MKIMVTGGLGFIGSEFVSLLTRELGRYKPDYEIIIVDKITYAANRDFLKVIKKTPKIRFVKKDINYLKTLYGCKIIYNFAAESHVDNSIKSSDEFIKSNINGVNNLLKLANKERVDLFVQISTDEVYGDKLRGESKETDALRPSSPYSASKAAAEMLCMSASRTYGFPVLITRSCNNFGIRQHKEKFIPHSIQTLLERKEIDIYGDGKNIREWISVIDNCILIYNNSMDTRWKEQSKLKIVNIGSGYRLSNIQMAEKIISLFGYGKIRFVEDRKGHDRRYALKADKIENTEKHLETCILDYYRRKK